jgi:teichuronic acid biosynthesis glycosyltransferase TuaC
VRFAPRLTPTLSARPTPLGGEGAPLASDLSLLTFSTLYPNSEQPNHGVFVENRIRHLVASGEAVTEVVAPVPFFPSSSGLFGSWGRYARIPVREERHGLEVQHPRFLVIPKLGMAVAPLLLYRSSLPLLRRILAFRRIDVIDAHYMYPDGVAAVWLGQKLGIPVVVTCRGTDVNLIPRYGIPRRLIQGAIAGAAALITVSAALREAVLELGAPPDKVMVLRNGVDTRLFAPPSERDAVRVDLGLINPTLVSVGHLIERKGHRLVIEALQELPDWQALIIGDGPERARLAALIQSLGLSGRVRLLGARPHAELPALYGAADALVLASSREGWANVLLEAMACGTPVVATNSWGNPEVVRTPEAGVIVERNPAAIAEGIQRLWANRPNRAATRAYAEQFSWDETTAGQLTLFRRVVAPS